MEVRFQIRGAREFDRVLKQLGADAANKIGTRAARAGARILADKAQARVPVRTGALAESIAVVAPRNADDGARVANVVIKGPMWDRLWHVTEWGTRFATAQPFLRPAMDESRSEVISAVASVMKRGIDQEARKLAKPIR